MRSLEHQKLAASLYPAVIEAGHVEMQHFMAGVAIERKADQSPVTAADREAEAIIVAALAALAPDIPVVAEEAVSGGHVPERADRFFLVDALDGTRLFIRGKPEFSVNIGLVENGKPVFGLIYIPPTGDLFVTAGKGAAVRAQAPCIGESPARFEDLSFKQLLTREPDLGNLKAFNSRTAGGASAELLTALNVRHAEPIGSSLKFCLIAAGEGDIYARLGETSEWDTAAGQAILEAAGGSVTTLDGAALTYGKSSATYLNPHFVAWGRHPLIPAVSAK
jgi:3'(2'), 5'-bisphosphate nucleotidase